MDLHDGMVMVTVTGVKVDEAGRKDGEEFRNREKTL